MCDIFFPIGHTSAKYVFMSYGSMRRSLTKRWRLPPSLSPLLDEEGKARSVRGGSLLEVEIHAIFTQTFLYLQMEIFSSTLNRKQRETPSRKSSSQIIFPLHFGCSKKPMVTSFSLWSKGIAITCTNGSRGLTATQLSTTAAHSLSMQKNNTSATWDFRREYGMSKNWQASQAFIRSIGKIELRW